MKKQVFNTNYVPGTVCVNRFLSETLRSLIPDHYLSGQRTVRQRSRHILGANPQTYLWIRTKMMSTLLSKFVSSRYIVVWCKGTK